MARLLLVLGRSVGFAVGYRLLWAGIFGRTNNESL